MLYALIAIGLALVFLGIPLLCRFLAQYRPCQHCGARLIPQKSLDTVHLRELSRELERYEYPEDHDDVFVCPSCRRAYQCLARSESRIGYYRPQCRVCNGPTYLLGQRMQTNPPASGYVRSLFKPNREELKHSGIECFVCTRTVTREADCVVCNTPVKAWYCDDCYALHIWFRPAGCEFEYFIPLVPQQEEAPYWEPEEQDEGRRMRRNEI